MLTLFIFRLTAPVNFGAWFYKMDMAALLVNAGALGVLIGSAFTALGFLYKNRLSELSAKRSCLYQLLEMERSMLFAQVLHDKSWLDLYLEVVNEEIPGAVPPDQHAEVKEISQKLLDSSFGAMTQDDHRDLATRFHDTIKQLSPISPLMAERINSNLKVKSVLPAFDSYHANLRVMAAEEASEGEVRAIEEVMSNYKYKLIENAIGALRSDVLHVAFHSSIIDYIRLLRRKPMRIREDIIIHQKDEIRTLIRELIEAQKKYSCETLG